MTTAIILLFSIILLFIIIAQLFTAFFIILGVPREKARFQVYSILTNTGFTTATSEIVMNSKKRRKVALAGMITGHIFSVAFVSAILAIITNLDTSLSNEVLKISLIAFGSFVLLYLFSLIPFVKRMINGMFEKIAEKLFMRNVEGNTMMVFEHYKNKIIAEITVRKIPEEIEGKTIEHAKFPSQFNMQILAVVRNGRMNNSVQKDDTIEQGDVITVFGQEDKIYHLFDIVKKD